MTVTSIYSFCIPEQGTPFQNYGTYSDRKAKGSWFPAIRVPLDIQLLHEGPKITVESKEMFVRFDKLIPFAISISNRHKIYTSTQQNNMKNPEGFSGGKQLPHPHLPLHHFHEYTATYKFAMNSLSFAFICIKCCRHLSQSQHQSTSIQLLSLTSHDSNKTKRFLFSKLLPSRALKLAANVPANVNKCLRQIWYQRWIGLQKEKEVPVRLWEHDFSTSVSWVKVERNDDYIK